MSCISHGTNQPATPVANCSDKCTDEGSTATKSTMGSVTCKLKGVSYGRIGWEGTHSEPRRVMNEKIRIAGK